MSTAIDHAEVRDSVQVLMDAVHQHGQGDELVVTLILETAATLKRRQPRGGGLSADQADYLVSSGAFTADELAETERDVAAGALAAAERQTRFNAIANTWSADEVARLLNVDTSRVRHRQAKGNLYGFLVGRKRRYPRWQFTAGNSAQEQVLPGLSKLVKAFPDDLHPASIEGFMTTAQEDLRVAAGPIASAPLAPTSYLMYGGNPEAVIGLLDSYLQS